MVTDTTVSVQGSSDLIGYEITGGKLLGIMPDVDANSLIIRIEATDDGSITLTIPRSVLDATINGEDDDFFVLVDGEEVDFDETITSTDRTLTIEFPAVGLFLVILIISPGFTPSPKIAGSVTKINGNSVGLQLYFFITSSASCFGIISCFGT